MAISTSALAGPLRRREREKARIIVMMAVFVQVPCMVSYQECNIDLETEKGACCRVAHVLACSAIGVFEASISSRLEKSVTARTMPYMSCRTKRYVKCLWTEAAVAEREEQGRREGITRVVLRASARVGKRGKVKW